MQNTYIWEVTPRTWPVVIRNCPKCDNSSVYECSGNFRVNANRNTIDVWLIYQCNKCNNTWNMEILSRTSVNSIDKKQYHKFITNDNDTAKHHAFDLSTLGRSKAKISYESIAYDITGDTIAYQELILPCEITINCSFPFDLRLDRLLVQQLGISREQIKKLWQARKIICSTEKNITKLKLRNHVHLILNP